MNFLFFIVNAIREAGVPRFVSVAALKFYRIIFSFQYDIAAKRALVQEFSDCAFTGILPTSESASNRFKKIFPFASSFFLSTASEICGHRFTIFGSPFTFGPTINWHIDPASGKEWKKKTYREGSLHYEGSLLDPKPVWELNRHQHFITLAQASFLSGDKTYVVELRNQWLHWIQENPYREGINWASPLEIGIRLISWTLAFQFIEHDLSKNDRSIITHSVWQQLLFLSSHLSLDKFVKTNHLIGEAAGLFIAAASFKFRESQQWKAKAQAVLEKEIVSQTFEDGVSKEQSSSYHRFVVDFFLIAYRTGPATDIPFSATFTDRLRKMLEYLGHLRTPDNAMPWYGDCDNGRGFLLAPSVNFWDPSGLVAAGRRIFNDPHIPLLKSNEETFWLLTEQEWDSIENLSPLPPQQFCRVFEKSGHVIMRNDQVSSNDYCFFRSGKFGLGGNGFSSHSHADLFSPIIYVNSNLICADTGTSIYIGNDDERNYLRSAAAHNSTFSSDWKFFALKRWFGWRKTLDGEIVKQTQTSNEWSVECRYRSLRVPFIRKIYYHPHRHQFQIEDMLTEDAKIVHTFFHLDSGSTVNKAGNKIQILRNGILSAAISIPEGVSLDMETRWISKSFGTKEKATVLHFTWEAKANIPVGFTIS
jgi:Heparinase II/III N-terminus/Heparinase II/III-like protein